jgi:hypothetical protein
MRRSRKGLFRPTHPEKYIGNAQNIVYRSSWEFKFFRWCDLTAGVKRWASEEFNIPYVSPVDGQQHRYFPDVYCEIESTDGSLKYWVVEIKPKAQTLPPKQPRKHSGKFLTEMATYAINQAKWAAANQFCVGRGWQFLVLTEDHLFTRATR